MKQYKEVDLIQGSDEWLLFRRNHLMATDSAKIMGKNPWSSALDCYQEKVNGKTTFITPAMQKGIDNEPYAREHLIYNNKINLKPKVFQSVKYPFMGASLDAISNNNKTLYEIKCVGHKTFEKALKGDISPMYIIQCNKQMLVMGLDSMSLFFYFNAFLTHTFKVERDEKLIESIIKAETKFWNEHFLTLTPPEKYGDDYERIEDEKANKLAQRWQELNEQEKALKEEKENIIKQLEEYTNGKNCIFTSAGLRHQVIERKGSVDWKEIQNVWNISKDDLDKYRKEGSRYSKFSEM